MSRLVIVLVKETVSDIAYLVTLEATLEILELAQEWVICSGTETQ